MADKTPPLHGLDEYLREVADGAQQRHKRDTQTQIVVACLRQWADEVQRAQTILPRLDVWFGEWEIVLPQDARESFRELLAELKAADGVNSDGGKRDGA
jgi:hypothetical protein